MSERPLPKSLLKVIARQPERFDDGWSEQDGFGDRLDQWAHWVYLAPGWRNAVLDPVAPLHIIHECTVRECVQQFNGAQPCDCAECQMELRLQDQGRATERLMQTLRTELRDELTVEERLVVIESLCAETENRLDAIENRLDRIEAVLNDIALKLKGA